MGSLADGLPASTASNERTAVGWYDAFCAELEISGWKNRGGSAWAIWFNTMIMMFFLEWLIPRMNKGKGGLPSSGMGYVYLILGRMARQVGFIFSYSPKRLRAHVKGLEWQWRQVNGPRTVKRKKPFTPFQLSVWHSMLNRNPLSPRVKVALTMISLAFCGMFRRSEYTHKSKAFNPKTQLTRGDVKWFTKDGRETELTPADLVLPPPGLFCTVAPPPCKNDQDGSKYHDDPLIFKYNSAQGDMSTSSLLSCANYLFELEREFPIRNPSERQTTPLFVDPTSGKAFRTADFDKIIKQLMRDARHENPRDFPDPSEQSLHSFRAGGALALKVAGAPPDIIKAMGRWRSDSWMLYIRDRRAEAMAWGDRMQTVALLDVERVPIEDRYRPLESGLPGVESTVARHFEVESIRESLERQTLEVLELPLSTERELEEEFQGVIDDLRNTDLCDLADLEIQQSNEKTGQQQMAKLAQSIAWPGPPPTEPDNIREEGNHIYVLGPLR